MRRLGVRVRPPAPYADVAQSVEHFLGTKEVVSSILAISSSYIYRCNSVGLECPSDTRVVSGSNPLICTIYAPVVQGQNTALLMLVSKVRFLPGAPIVEDKEDPIIVVNDKGYH